MNDRPLRILMVLNLPWDRRLGAVRVFSELAGQWRSAGHTVDIFCLTDAFPSETSQPALTALRQLRFAVRAGRFLRQAGSRYDVVDALAGTLPFPRASLGFRGLLVARSVGLPRAYEEFARLAHTRWPNQPRGRFLGRFFYRLISSRMRRAAERSLQEADLINLPNSDENALLQADPTIKARLLVQPYGLTAEFGRALAGASNPALERQQRQILSFIGMWSVRKGARDWAEIVQRVRREIPSVQFHFLGTLTSDDQVRADLKVERDDPAIRLVRDFEPEQLPALLAPSVLGIFPSYVEGFGFAVLEQLAAGLPCVAYDVSGPRQILAPLRRELLCPAGDVAALARRIVELLRMHGPDYAQLAERCQARAADYSWSQIAAETLEAYRAALTPASPVRGTTMRADA